MHDFAAERRDSLVRHLRKHIAGEVRFDDTSRHLYATDASNYQIEPLGVVIPQDARRPDRRGADRRRARRADHRPRRRHQPVRPVDRPRPRHRLLEVPQPRRRGGRRAAARVRVQPGVVLDQLNRELAPYGLQFGPDVATASRATLGGMIGNNSAGARSIVYGKTIDHVRSLDGGPLRRHARRRSAR